MKTRIMVLFVLSSCALFACGGNSSESKSGQAEITDANGRTLHLYPGSYKKIVCIGAGALRLYSYIGDNADLAGVEDIDNLDAEGRPAMFDGVARPYFIANKDAYRGLPSCGKGGPNAQQAEAEKILSCQPDLVISEYEDVEKADALQKQLGLPVITLKYGSNGVFDDRALSSISLIGKVLAKESKAETLLKFVDDAKKDIQSRTKNLASDKKVYICGLGNWGTTNHLMTAKNYTPFQVANIHNIADDILSNPGVQAIEKETLIANFSNIDTVFIDAAAVKNIKPLYKEDPTLFDGCKAVENGEVYLQMAHNAYYTNLETALMNTYYNAKIIHPTAFEDVDMVAKTNEITKAFLGKELAQDIFSYPQSFGGYQKIDVKEFFNA